MDRAALLQLALIALFGALGSVARYATSGAVHAWFGTGFAWGTLTVNVAGSFALGLLMRVGTESDLVPPLWRMGLATGFMGAFTTFSTLSYETLRFVEEGEFHLAAANVAVNLAVGLPAVWAGSLAGRLLLGER